MQTFVTEKGTFMSGKDGDELLANFTAEIREQVIYHDGPLTRTELTLVGEHDGKKLPDVTVTASEFPAMSWVNPAWGYNLIISPTGSATAKLRAAIQAHSKPKVRHVYTATGWHEDEFCFHGGSIGAKGLNPKRDVTLPHELSRYQLPEPTNLNAIKSAVKASLLCAFLPPAHVGWPSLLAVYRPTIQPADFACHLSGRTGTFKSEWASLLQSHYGMMDARNLPASWSSTGNALEALCYRAKDVLIVVDDFIPVGTSWQLRQYAKTADQLIRGQGNQSGRSRLTDTSKLQQTMYPRGLIYSTGEDVPEGHSVRGRMLIMELTPGDITADRLSKRQEERPQYPLAMAAWLRWLATHRDKVIPLYTDEFKRYRDSHLSLGHSRTPTALASLWATAVLLLRFAEHSGAIAQKDAHTMSREIADALETLGNQQEQYLLTADPCSQFCESLREVLQSRMAHVNARDGGIPKQPTLLGWEKEDNLSGVPTFKRYGKCIGWQSGSDLLLDAGLAYETAKRHSRGSLSITKQTLLKRLRDAGILSETDAQRQRNTVRKNCEGAIRTVIAIAQHVITGEQEQ